jgi:hypothetical protein
MKKLISLFLILFSVAAHAQVYDTYDRSQATREWQATQSHYESMKPSKKSTSNSNVSGDYNANGWGQGISSERVAAGERNDALQKEWNDKVNKLVKLIESRKIGKSSSDYYSFMEAAKESFTGYNSDYTIRTIFPKTASEYEQKANDKSSNFYKQWFLAADKMKPVIKTTTSNNTQGTYSSQPVLHKTQYGSTSTKHPKYFSEVNAMQKDKGYKRFDDIAEFVQRIINDGENNYAYITDKSTTYENAKCNCDAVFGLNVYYKNYNAMEFGVFYGGGRWKYPFLRMYISTSSKQECESVFEDFKKKFASNGKYKKYESQYTRDDRDVYFDYNQNDGFTYQVWMEKTSDVSIRMGIDKQDAPIVEKARSNTVYESLKLKETKSSIISKKAIITNEYLYYSNLNELSCFDWSWATSQQKQLSISTGWGNYKPKKNDEGIVVYTTKHCSNGVDLVFLKIGNNYVPMCAEAIKVIN